MQDETTLETIRAYSLGAKKYIEMTDQLSYFNGLQAMLDRFIELLPGDKVLDVAFGSGRDILYFLSKDINVEGVELTKEFIDLFQKRVDIPLHFMDMRDLKFSPASFDGIWCCSSFLHIPREDALRTLKGFSEVMKPSGMLFLSLKEGLGEEWVSQGNPGEFPRFFVYYTYEKIQEMLSNTNFKIVYEERQANRNINKPVWISLIAQKVC